LTVAGNCDFNGNIVGDGATAISGITTINGYDVDDMAAGGGVDPVPGQYRGSSNQSMSTTVITIDLQSETYDPDSNYSVSSDVVTIAAAGYYIVSHEVMASVDGGGGNQRCNLKSWLTKNGTSSVVVGSYGASFVDENSTPDFSSGSTCLVLLAASDTLRIRANLSQNTDVSTVATQTHMTLYKVRDV